MANFTKSNIIQVLQKFSKNGLRNLSNTDQLLLANSFKRFQSYTYAQQTTIDKTLSNFSLISKNFETLISKNPNQDIVPKHQAQNEELLYETIWDLYLPLSNILIHKQTIADKRTTITGVLGSQGTGKTLLSKMVGNCLETLGKRVIFMSSDDFYLPYENRLRLQKDKSFLRQRGPPGTHDTELMFEVFSKLNNPTLSATDTLKIPIFDKSLHKGQGDRAGFKTIENLDTIDMCIFEGWYTGLNSVSEDKLPVKSELAKFSNEQLKGYKGWDFQDSLIVMKPENFNYSYQWRLDAEKRMGGGMNKEQLERFVSYFMESLNPEVYYGNLFESKPRYLSTVLTIDIDHKLVNAESY